LKCCERALKLNPISIKALHTKGLALSHLGKKNKAIMSFEKALEINPEDFGILSNLGVILSELGDYEKGILLLEKALKIESESADGYGNLGAIYMNMHNYNKALTCFRKAKEYLKKNESDYYKEKAQMYELWALNAIDLVDELNQIDDLFLISLNSETLIDLRKETEEISLKIEQIVVNFKNRDLPKDALDLLKSKEICIKILKNSLKYESVNLEEIQIAKKVFSRWNLDNFIIASNSLENFSRIVSKFNSIEEIPKNKERKLLNLLKNFQYFDGILTQELKHQIKSEGVLTEPKIVKKEVKVDFISLNAKSKKKGLRICLVQFKFDLSKTFPYKLKNNIVVKNKIIKGIKIAKENQVDIICFPELSFDEEFIKDLKEYRDIIIICGTFYNDDNYNTCILIYNDDEYLIKKMHPSPYSEGEVATGKGMKKGNEIKIFHINDGDLKFTVLICMDFYYESWRLFDYEFDGSKGVDYIFVPSYNDDKERFQKHADAYCYNNPVDVIKVSNTECISCIFGPAHKSLLERLKNDKFRGDDQFKYKLCEASGEMIIIADLNKTPTHVPTPLGTTPRIKIIRRFVYNIDDWKEID